MKKQEDTTNLPTDVLGAGPRVTKMRPGKRMRAEHRQVGTGLSLREYARTMARGGSAVAEAWLDAK